MTDPTDIRHLKSKIQAAMLENGMHPDLRSTSRIMQTLREQVATRPSSSAFQVRSIRDWMGEWLEELLVYIDRIGGGVYSDTEILGGIRRGHIICHPLNVDNIKGSSIDVTLGGDGFWVANANKRPIYDPRDQAEVERFFRLEKPSRHDEFCDKHGLTPMSNVPGEALVIPVYPGERILAHTHEFIGIVPPGTSSMQSRSTWGRNGIAVCIDAGWGDPGYATRWTMEIHNFNQELVLLVVGDRIAQIVLHKTGAVARPYGGAKSKYHDSAELEAVIASWDVSMMLPRAYLDTYTTPLPLHPIMDYSTVQIEEE